MSPSEKPVAGCIEFHGTAGTYRAPAGSMSLSVAVSAGTDDWWHRLRDTFYLLKAPCVFGGPVWLEASPVDQVYADACDLMGARVETDTPATVIVALAAQTGVEVVGPTDVTLDGYAGARFDISMRPGLDATACTDGTAQLFDGVANMDADQTATVYVLDVDGAALGLVVYWGEDKNAALTAEVDAIIASLRIEA